MLERVAAAIHRHSMLAPGDRVGVAVSGGADSVCLLHVLRELAPRWNLCLSVVHLNHKLRGAESDADAAFVAGLAAGMNLPCVVREAQLAAGNLEQAARNARLALFREIVQSAIVNRVATGHTRSDQAETVLFRFLRGAGTAGLSGIRPITRGGLIRPLLAIDRAETEQFLRDRGIPWREDSTNAGLDFARNRIRHQLLPLLEREWNPAIGSVLAHTAEWAQAEEAYWEQEVTKLWEAGVEPQIGFVSLKTSALSALPLAAGRRLVRRAIGHSKGNLRSVDFRHIEAVLALALGPAGHGRLQIPGLNVVRSFDWIRFGNLPAEPAYSIHPSVPGVARLAEGREISLELIEKVETSAPLDCVYNTRMGCLDWQRLSGSLLLRNWQPGDRYQPLGRSEEYKIRTLFQKARIPSWERKGWPVLLDGASIVWTRHFGAATRVAAHPGSSVILRIRETG